MIEGSMVTIRTNSPRLMFLIVVLFAAIVANAKNDDSAPRASDPALERVPKEHEEKRGREEGHELEDWIAAEDRRLGKRLLRAVQRAGA